MFDVCVLFVGGFEMLFFLFLMWVFRCIVCCFVVCVRLCVFNVWCSCLCVSVCLCVIVFAVVFCCGCSFFVCVLFCVVADVYVLVCCLMCLLLCVSFLFYCGRFLVLFVIIIVYVCCLLRVPLCCLLVFLVCVCGCICFVLCLWLFYVVFLFVLFLRACGVFAVFVGVSTYFVSAPSFVRVVVFGCFSCVFDCYSVCVVLSLCLFMCCRCVGLRLFELHSFVRFVSWLLFFHVFCGCVFLLFGFDCFFLGGVLYVYCSLAACVFIRFVCCGV